jgi:pyruvate,water dikinase
MERGVVQVWEHEYAPRILQACQRWRAAPYDALRAAELADSLDGLLTEAEEMMRLTMVVAVAFSMPTNQLADFCEEELGADGPRVAATLLQGFDNLSAAAGAGLGELARLAADLPEVAAALREGRHGDLEAAEGGQRFLAALGQYLDEYGWRADFWGNVHVPTWAEDPSTPLKLISRYLDDAGLAPAAAVARAVARRGEAEREARARLDGEKLERFEGLLAAARDHVRISEGRAFWQLTIDGSIRVPFLALGRRLVDAGVIEAPNDAFFLTMDELKAAARNPSQSRAADVATRKADLERWSRLTPPDFVGAPPDDRQIPEAFKRAIARFWGDGVTPPADRGVIRGHPASRGVVRGRARILRELGEADRLQKGDILVCRSTAPPWTPLFSVAAGVVTDSGGVLSHSAICAREFGIPCVVGTRVGTQQIPEGAMVTVDGGDGTVRIEA